MTSQSLLTYGAKIFNIQQEYYAPVATVNGTLISSLYCVLAKVDNWVDDNNPPAPTQDQKTIKNFLKNVFAAKQITSNDISPVITRINWTSGVTYDYYRDDIDIFEKDTNGFPIYSFYVKNKYDQVFKCLWNAGGAPSTYEPYFEPGSYNTNGIYQNLDGYKWHYIFTIDTASKVKFMDTSWIPVPVSGSAPNPLDSPTGEGTGGLDVITVLAGGQGYDEANAIVSLVVTGDGNGANGTVVITNGAVTDILITNPGTNYNYANAYIMSANGSGAILGANTVSPIGGHGYNPVAELGCDHVMISTEFTGSEGSKLPTDITYHQIGLLINPTTNSLSPLPANGSIYQTSTDLVVSSGFGLFVNDEIVYQGTSIDTATFIGTVLTFDSSTNRLSLINTTGTLTINAPMFGNISGTARTLLSYTTPDFITLSGYLSYMENRSAITRSSDGIEQFKIVLGY